MALPSAEYLSSLPGSISRLYNTFATPSQLSRDDWILRQDATRILHRTRRGNLFGLFSQFRRWSKCSRELSSRYIESKRQEMINMFTTKKWLQRLWLAAALAITTCAPLCAQPHAQN